MPNAGFYSQFAEDEWICQHLSLPTKGVYVDVGAGHPRTISNTAFLRDRGWTGLAVDACADYIPAWEGFTFEVAIVSDKPMVGFYLDPTRELSRITTGEPTFPAVTLESLLSKHGIGVIDFLSLDVEAHEYDALMSMNFQAHRPKIVISEYSTFCVGEDMRVKDFLVEQGYEVMEKTVCNFIFIDPKVVKRTH
jgi:hypothetical protein